MNSAGLILDALTCAAVGLVMPRTRSVFAFILYCWIGGLCGYEAGAFLWP